MAAHARLKCEFTEDEKCNNLMSWFIWVNFITFSGGIFPFINFSGVNIPFITFPGENIPFYYIFRWEYSIRSDNIRDLLFYHRKLQQSEVFTVFLCSHSGVIDIC